MNKGLEVIEAHFLFGLPYDRIEVVVHPQSIVHGMARMRDGALIAHVGHPDMRVPISYALTYPGPLRHRRAAARPVAAAVAHVRAAGHRHLPLPRAGARRGRGRRHGAVRAQRRERGGGGRVPRRPDRLPRHRGAGRRRARRRAGRTGRRASRRCGAPTRRRAPPSPTGWEPSREHLRRDPRPAAAGVRARARPLPRRQERRRARHEVLRRLPAGPRSRTAAATPSTASARSRSAAT